jgi:glycosyltransferase involved in cell wall biosynthesis
MNSQKPVVSVWMITYNHEKYISQAIESVLSQITDFSFDLVIGEDCSTDDTRRICDSYEQKYPDIVRVLRHATNVGIHQNIVQTLEACQGEYVALLEGDDYWTDVHKLQKQFDFLSTHPDFVMCYQKTLEVNELSGKSKITNENDNQETGIVELLERGWFMRTGSLFFRNKLIGQFPTWYFNFNSTDYMLHILIAEHGKIGFLNETTSVYRRHEGGITQAFENKIFSFNERKLKLLDLIDKYFDYKYTRQVKIQKETIYHSSFINRIKRMDGVKDLWQLLRLLPFVSYSYLSKRLINYVTKRA